jgi:hypothetical protein
MRRTSLLQRLVAVAAVAASGLAVTGCGVQHWPARLEELGRSRVPAESDAIDVALAVDDRNRVDSWDDFYEPIHRSAFTGPLWLKVFRGDPATRPLFTLRSTAILVDSIGAGVGARRITYVAEGTLSFDGRDDRIHAQGRAVTTQTIFACGAVGGREVRGRRRAPRRRHRESSRRRRNARDRAASACYRGLTGAGSQADLGDPRKSDWNGPQGDAHAHCPSKAKSSHGSAHRFDRSVGGSVICRIVSLLG